MKTRILRRTAKETIEAKKSRATGELLRRENVIKKRLSAIEAARLRAISREEKKA